LDERNEILTPAHVSATRAAMNRSAPSRVDRESRPEDLLGVSRAKALFRHALKMS
jgi:hypothetical protein